MNLPNLLTALRIALVPVFGMLWLGGRHAAALVVFALAGLTDLLDGLAARLLDQRTRLGSFLDPAADKFMLLVAFLVAASVGAVPWWLAGLVIGRDLALAAGFAAWTFLVHRTFDPRRWHPTRIGKYATFYQLLTIGLALVARAADARALAPWVAALVLLAAATTVVSWVQYFVRGVIAFRAPGPRPAGGAPS